MFCPRVCVWAWGVLVGWKSISTAAEKFPILSGSYWLKKMSAFLVLLTFLKILFVTTAIFGHLALNGHPRNYPACDTSHGVAMETIKTSPPPLFLAFIPRKSTNRCLIEHLPLSIAFCEDCLRQFRFGPNGAWPEMIV